MPEGTCSIDDCDRPRAKRTWCNMHYLRWRRYGDPERPNVRNMNPPALCQVQDCEAPHYAREMCFNHYTRWRQSPDRPGKPCSVDGCRRTAVTRLGLCRLHKDRLVKHGSTTWTPPHRSRGEGRIQDGYLRLTIHGHPLASKRGNVFEHRVVLFDEIGPGSHPCHWCGALVAWEIQVGNPMGLRVDHLDGDRLNNAIENLVPSCSVCNSARGRAGNPIDWKPRSEAA